MIYVYVALGALVGVVVCLLALIVVIHARHNQLLTAMSIQSLGKEQSWNNERQQLLDRIQAPSFAEYKHQEVRFIKAQTGEKEPPKLEPL